MTRVNDHRIERNAVHGCVIGLMITLAGIFFGCAVYTLVT